MRKIILLLLYFFTTACFIGAQEAADNNELKIIPPSPSVAELGRYGLASANLSDGSFATQIPIYEYKTKNLSIPITLSYSTNGLQVDKIASRVGMDWSLMAGGSIGRMVLGNPDELSTWATYPSDWPNTTGATMQNFVSLAANGAVETIPDIYNFSFNGYSGRFLYINNQIIKLEQNNLDIQKNSSGFTVIDKNGVKYLFNDTERTISFSGCVGHPYEGVNWITSAWMISKIIHPLGDTIYFKYKGYDFTYASGISQTYTSAVESQSSGASGCDCPNIPAVVSCVSRQRIQGVMIDRIYSNYRGLVEFGYTERFDLNGDSALNQIKVYDALSNSLGTSVTYYDSIPIKAFSMEYAFPDALTTFIGPVDTNSNKRMYLSSFEECENEHGLCKTYSFDYHKLDSLPQRMSFAQDHFGYFNGKNNASLIPVPANTAHYNRFVSYGFGSRTPDWRYASRGCLSKITYPTGGTDSIVYESHTVYHSGGYNCTDLNITKSVEADGSSQLKKVYSYYSDIFTINCPQTIMLQVGNITLSGAIDYPRLNYLTTACFVAGDGTILNSSCIVGGDDYGHTLQAGPQEWKAYQVYLPAGTYRLRITVQGPSRGHANFTFMDNDDNAGNINISGIRVKKIMTKASPDDIALERRYYYNFTDSIASSGSAANEFPVYGKNIFHYVRCSIPGYPGAPGGCTRKDCGYTQYSSDNFHSLYAYGGNHIYYTTVTEDLGNNFENGYIEHQFQVIHDQSASPLIGELQKGTPLSNFGIYNGFEYLTRQYKNTGTAFQLINQTRRTRKSDPRLSAENVFYSFRTEPGYVACTMPSSLADYPGLHISEFSLLGKWLYSDSTIITEYDDKGGQITTVKVDSFANSVHQQVTRSQTFDSKGANTSTRIYYPLDNVIYSDPAANAARDSLIARHMYSGPLKVQNYTGPILLTETENSYSNSFMSVPVLHKVYETVRTNPKELKTEITGYGRGGTILDVASKGADLASYIWDYKESVPVAQVTNAASAAIAYTSFEADSKGGWQFSNTPVSDPAAPTGKKVYFIDGESTYLSRNNLTNGIAFIVSYWSKDGSKSVTGASAATAVPGAVANGWTYYEHKVSPASGTITVSGSGYIDELRLYPQGALMTSYTYDPLIGITSQCDANNNISYYQYDDMDRLAIIRDRDRHIVKKFCYNYAGQPEDCTGIITYFNAPHSSLFTRNCGPDSAGSQVTYIVPARRYSSTVSQQYVDSLALADITANGQAYANANGTCSLIIYFNTADSATFSKTCGTDSVGTTVTYTVPAGTHSSTISQHYADSLAQADIDANGQAYANAHGACYYGFVNLTSEREGNLLAYKATYYNNSTGLQYVFTIANQSGVQSLGTVPAGTYTVTIAKTGATANLTFGVYDNSCSYISIYNTSATFYNVVVSNMSACNGVFISSLN